MAVPNIIELRQLLRERFPGLRTRADELRGPARPCWSTGLAQLDARIGGGFTQGLSEILVPGRTVGGASLLRFFIQHAARQRQFVALIDSHDSFDAAALHAAVLDRLLWIRCRNADETMKAADLVLRDGNLSLVMIDLAMAPVSELRKVATPIWYRFQRILEERGSTCIVFTPRTMVSPAQLRLTLRSRLNLDALAGDAEAMAESIDIEVSDARRGMADDLLRQTA